MSKIFIRKIYTESAQRFNSEYVIVNGRREAPTKRNRSNSGTLLSIADGGNGVLNIGFTERMENPYNTQDSLPSNWLNSDIYTRDTISRQTYFEIKHNVKPGTYDPKSYVISNKKSPGTYLQSIKMRLKDGRTELDLSNPKDELFHEYFLRSPLVAENYQAGISSSKAEYYFWKAEQDEDTKASKSERIQQAMVNWNTVINKFPSKKLDILILCDKQVKGTITDTAIQNRMWDWITKDKSINSLDQSVRLDRFNKYFTMLNNKSKAEKDRFDASALVQKLVNARVLTQRQDKYTWPAATGSNLEKLARSTEEAIQFMLEPDNKEHVDKMKEELKRRA